MQFLISLTNIFVLATPLSNFKSPLADQSISPKFNNLFAILLDKITVGLEINSKYLFELD